MHDYPAEFSHTLNLQQMKVDWKWKINWKYNAFKMSFFTNRFDIQIDLAEK